MCEFLNTLRTELETFRKEIQKETENNENLTSVHVRVEDNIEAALKILEIKSDKLDRWQSELIKITKFSEQEQREFESVHSVGRECVRIRHRTFVVEEGTASRRFI